MQELDDLIYQQASYSALIAWMQKYSACSYIEACTQVNAELQRYRLQHQGSLANSVTHSKVRLIEVDETAFSAASSTDDDSSTS